MPSFTYERLLRTFSLLAVAVAAAPALADTLYQQTNLVSDLPGVAQHMDTNLANPWGIDRGPETPFWIADNKTGLSTIYDGKGNARPLVVAIPPPAGMAPPSAPTGVAFSGGMHFAADSSGARPLFMFATEDGTVAGWSGGTSAVRRIDESASGAVFKGLALDSKGSSSLLFVTNFNAGRVDAFDANFAPTMPGAFVDRNLPSGFAPFNIENIDGKLWVTFAKQDQAKHDDEAGPGRGFIDVFDTSGKLERRVASADPHLNSPWGMAMAPAGFGKFSGDLLVGNFGDGRINAFDPKTGSFVGQLQGKSGPIQIEGLWGLRFGNGGNAGAATTLFFTAGIPGSGSVEDHGLFGALTVVPEPHAAVLLALGLGCIAFTKVCRSRPSL